MKTNVSTGNHIASFQFDTDFKLKITCFWNHWANAVSKLYPNVIKNKRLLLYFQNAKIRMFKRYVEIIRFVRRFSRKTLTKSTQSLPKTAYLFVKNSTFFHTFVKLGQTCRFKFVRLSRDFVKFEKIWNVKRRYGT